MRERDDQNLAVHRMASYLLDHGERTEMWNLAQQTGFSELEIECSLRDLVASGFLEIAHGCVVETMPLSLSDNSHE